MERPKLHRKIKSGLSLPVLVVPVVIAIAVCKGVTLCSDWGSLPATELTGTCVIWIGGPWAGCVITCHTPQYVQAINTYLNKVFTPNITKKWQQYCFTVCRSWFKPWTNTDYTEDFRIFLSPSIQTPEENLKLGHTDFFLRCIHSALCFMSRFINQTVILESINCLCHLVVLQKTVKYSLKMV